MESLTAPSALPVLPERRSDLGVPRVSAADSRPQVAGKFIYLGGNKFYIKGATYGPFEPEADGSEYHQPAGVERDFALMASRGINAVRTYTVPPTWLLDIAQAYGLRVMVGIPWEQHITFLDQPKIVDGIETRIREAIRTCAGHPAVLCYSIGNEIPANIVRWHGRRPVERMLERFYQAAKSEDPGALITYVNYPSTEYLSLPFLDLVAFNVYLEQPETLSGYLARLQNIAGDRPLLMAEVGLDSLRNGDAKQAEVLQWQIDTAFAGAAAGLFLFSWTDEWYRGGQEITDWNFGLVTRDRQPKPALNAVIESFRRAPLSPAPDWPMVSIVICTYNGSRTIRQSLDAVGRVQYPSFEVLVINDGSSDSTPDIIAEFGVRLISIPNGGLSNARNIGWQNARGPIVAYLDDDAAPDPHWLAFLVSGLLSSDCAGIGGPNISPLQDNFVAQCVDHSPGNPTHVLIDDREAEHLPGCNMAFWRHRIAAIGGFDATFRIAGDDVDFCWRLQDQGWTLGFSAGAVVWHHRRDTVKTYWKQQMNYGRAEAMLERKWPAKYNVAGHLTWSGRVYAKGSPSGLSRRQRIYHGTWGTALFQSIYEPAPNTWSSILVMPEWFLLLGLLAIGATLSLFSWPLGWAMVSFLVALSASLLNAISVVHRIHFRRPTRSRWELFTFRAAVTGLHLVQPVARLWGRISFGLTPWRQRGTMSFAAPWRRTLSRWDETWRSAEDRLHDLEAALRKFGAIVARGGNFDRWDLGVRGGLLGHARLLMTIEEHGQGKQLVRLKVWPARWQLVVVSLLLTVSLSASVLASLEFWPALILNLPCLLLLGRLVYELGTVVGAVRRAFLPEASSNSSHTDEANESPVEFVDPSATRAPIDHAACAQSPGWVGVRGGPGTAEPFISHVSPPGHIGGQTS